MPEDSPLFGYEAASVDNAQKRRLLKDVTVRYRERSAFD